MFLGDYKKRRNISLGGTKTTLDKSGLLREAAAERQKRERERLEQTSAAILQAAWKGFLCRQKVYQLSRNEWDVKRNSLNVNQEEIVKLTAQLWFFYSPSKDKQRFVQWIKVLLEPSPSNSNLSILTLLCRNLDFETRWPSLLGKCIDESVRLLLDLELGFNTGSSHVKLLLQVSRTQQGLDDSITDKDIELQERLITRMVDDGLFRKLRLLMGRHPSLAPHDGTSPWLLLYQLLESSNSCSFSTISNSLFIDQFVIHILSLAKLSLDSATSSLLSPWIPKFLQVLGRLEVLETAVTTYPNTDAQLVVLIHVLQLVTSSVSLNMEETKSFVQAIMKIMESLPSTMFASLQTVDEDDDDKDVKMHEPSTTARSLHYDTLVSLLSNLLDKDFILHLLKSMAPSDTEYFGSVTSLFVALLSRLPSKKNETCNVLLFKAPIPLMRMLFTRMQKCCLWDSALKKKSDISTLLEPPLMSDWAMFILFAELYGRSLLTMSDDEFFGTRNYLIIEEILSFSTGLNNLTFKILWEGQNLNINTYPALGLDMDRVASLFADCLQQIHIRDSRRQFTPVNHWHYFDKEEDTHNFIQPLLSIPDTPNLNQAKTMRESRIATCHQVLQVIPFVVPFETRVKLFRLFVKKDRQDEPSFAPVARFKIHRKKVFEDGYTHLNALGPRLKGKVAITFISEHGLEEAGIDGGGVFKEFLTSLSKEAFNENCGLFSATRDQLLYPCPYSYATQAQQLSHFEFLGRIIGKALYEGVLVDVAFADFFLVKWIGRQGFLDDLVSLDPELYQGLLFLKQYQGDVEDLGLYFTISEQEFGQTRNVDLIKNGSSQPVTNENRIQYIYLSVHYKVNLQIKRQCEAFFRGLKDLIEPSWIRMFNQQELQLLLGGASTPIDMQDFKKNVVYAGGYDLDHPTIQMFWNLVSDFTQDQKRNLIKFITSCPRPPLLGFGELSPLICIRSAGTELERLPTASTCMNLLKLPVYQDATSFKQKLEYAISAGAGFDLS